MRPRLVWLRTGDEKTLRRALLDVTDKPPSFGF